MDLILKRQGFINEATIGTLDAFLDGAPLPIFRCFTLEDLERDEKIKGKTAIPKGRYQVIVNWSNRFNCYLPILLNVPNFEGVRIHAGNSAADTEGCILVGLSRRLDKVLNSRAAMNVFFEIVESECRRGEVWLTIQ